MGDKIRVTLSNPTIFPDYNKKENLDEMHAQDYIDIERMRYGHIKQMQSIAPEEQTQWAIKTLTGLSDNDIDQFYAEDAAEVTKTIFGFIEKYFSLAKKMWSAPGEEGNHP